MKKNIQEELTRMKKLSGLLNEGQDPGNHMYPIPDDFKNKTSFSKEDINMILDWLYNNVDQIGKNRIFDMKKFLEIKLD